MTTLNELIESLQDLLEENPELGEKPVNVAYQSSYPLAGFIGNVTLIDNDEYGELPWLAIIDNHSEPYAPRAAWEHR